MHAVRGVSLIELMVALAIGSLLVLGLVEVFSASRTAYQLSEGLARVQENGRFAMDYVQRDFRMGGHMGCVNDQSRFLPENAIGPRSSLASTFLAAGDQQTETYGGTGANLVADALRFDLPVQGYEANGTGAAAGDEVDLPTAENLSQTDWTPALPDDLHNALDNRVGDSDILVLRQFSPRGAQVTAFAPGDTATITVDPDQFENLTEDQLNPGLFGIADCMSSGVFSATTTDPDTGAIVVTGTAGANRSPMLGNEPYVAGQAFVYVAQTIVYYVGINATGVPALYRLRYTMEPGDAAPTVDPPEELVEGIESMQLKYGVDSFPAANQRPSGNMGTTQVANAATPWRRVGAVQVGLVARSANPAAATQRDDSVAKLSALGVAFNSPDPADGRFRTVYENTIAMRNRLFGH